MWAAGSGVCTEGWLGVYGILTGKRLSIVQWCEWRQIIESVSVGSLNECRDHGIMGSLFVNDTRSWKDCH